MDQTFHSPPRPPDPPPGFGGAPGAPGNFNQPPPPSPPPPPSLHYEMSFGDAGPRRTRGMAGVAWLLIIGLVIGMIALRQLAGAELMSDPNPDDPVGLTVSEITAKYVMGSKYMPGGAGASGAVFAQSRPSLDVGSVNQRLAFVVLTSEMMGSEAASDVLSELETRIEQARVEHNGSPDPVHAAAGDDSSSQTFKLREEQQTVLEALHTLYRTESGEPAERPRVEALTDDQRLALTDTLGWFGRLALHPPDDGTDERKALEAGALTLVITLFVVFVIGTLAGLTGLGLLITFVVLAATRRIRSGVDRQQAGLPKDGAWHHGVYAETFALWMGLFVLLLVGAELLSLAAPEAGLLISAAAFFCSLIALAWPKIRGIDWTTVRQEIGWTAGRDPAAEPVIGVLAYLGALPLLVVGVIGVLVCMFIQQLLAGGEGPLFGGSGGAAHPIVAEIASGDVLSIAQIYLVASVAAPIVEETMFRGVLYRHLRDATRYWALPLSVLFSGLVNCFVFAIIHPQGWVAAPALMSLAFAFTLAREWRGTLVPPMLMHGLSNGIVMTILIICLNA